MSRPFISKPPKGYTFMRDMGRFGHEFVDDQKFANTTLSWTHDIQVCKSWPTATEAQLWWKRYYGKHAMPKIVPVRDYWKPEFRIKESKKKPLQLIEGYSPVRHPDGSKYAGFKTPEEALRAHQNELDEKIEDAERSLKKWQEQKVYAMEMLLGFARAQRVMKR